MTDITDIAITDIAQILAERIIRTDQSIAILTEKFDKERRKIFPEALVLSPLQSIIPQARRISELADQIKDLTTRRVTLWGTVHDLNSLTGGSLTGEVKGLLLRTPEVA